MVSMVSLVSNVLRAIRRRRNYVPIHKHVTLLMVTTCLVAALSGCGSNDSKKIPDPPGGKIPISQEAADRLRENFNQAMQEATTNEFRLQVTNEEITSLLALSLQESGEVPFTDPQVWFTSGRIYITGDVEALGPAKVHSLIVATAVVKDDKVVVQVEEARTTMFPFPGEVLNSVSQTMNETFMEMQLDLKIIRLEILEGEMIVVGTRSEEPGTP